MFYVLLRYQDKIQICSYLDKLLSVILYHIQGIISTVHIYATDKHFSITFTFYIKVILCRVCEHFINTHLYFKYNSLHNSYDSVPPSKIEGEQRIRPRFAEFKYTYQISKYNIFLEQPSLGMHNIEILKNQLIYKCFVAYVDVQ